MLSTLTMAASAGFLSTLHCLGMCGGIVAALALGSTHGNVRSSVLAVAYNAGRVASYASLGALAGLVALPADAAAWGYRLLQALGLIALVLAGLRLGGWRAGTGALERLGLGLWRRVSPLTRRLLPIDRVSRAVPAGLLWGLLPCGLVYAMLPVAAGSGSIGGSALTMIAFGVGTMPGMVLASVLAQRVGGFKAGLGLRRFAGATLIALACVWFGLQWLGGGHEHHAHAGHLSSAGEPPAGHAAHPAPPASGSAPPAHVGQADHAHHAGMKEPNGGTLDSR